MRNLTEAQMEVAAPITALEATALFERICHWENLLLAYQRAAAGKRGRRAAATFEYRLEDQLVELRDELRQGRYQPGPYHSFYIHEPKRRLISAAPFRDRVVHHALCNIIEPRFEQSFSFDSYANRVGKGTHRALNRAQTHARRHRFVLQCDIEQFFPSIDHAILRACLAKKIDDARTMDLIDRILASGRDVLAKEYRVRFFDGDSLLAAARPRGLPIGNLTSQFWANVYLHPIDHFVQRELGCGAYIRYVDDLLVFGDDPKALRQCRDRLIDRLGKLRLTLHPGAHVRPVTEGIPFLGFVIWPQLRRLKGRKVTHFRRQLRARLDAYRAGDIGLTALTATVQGWVEHAQHGNTRALRARTLRGLPVPRVDTAARRSETHG